MLKVCDNPTDGSRTERPRRYDSGNVDADSCSLFVAATDKLMPFWSKKVFQAGLAAVNPYIEIVGEVTVPKPLPREQVLLAARSTDDLSPTDWWVCLPSRRTDYDWAL